MSNNSAAVLLEKPQKSAISPFATGKMKVPDHLLNRGRSSYGWEELDSKGKFKLIPRDKITNARSSAHTYAKANAFKIATMAYKDPETEVIETEQVWYNADGQEVAYDDIPDKVKASPEKLEKAGYWSKDIPKNYMVIRVS